MSTKMWTTTYVWRLSTGCALSAVWTCSSTDATELEGLEPLSLRVSWESPQTTKDMLHQYRAAAKDALRHWRLMARTLERVVTSVPPQLRIEATFIKVEAAATREAPCPICYCPHNADVWEHAGRALAAGLLSPNRSALQAALPHGDRFLTAAIRACSLDEEGAHALVLLLETPDHERDQALHLAAFITGRTKP